MKAKNNLLFLALLTILVLVITNSVAFASADPQVMTVDNNKNKIYDGLDETLKQKGPEGRTSVIVVFDRVADDEMISNVQRSSGIKELKPRYRHFPMTSAVLTSSQIKKLSLAREVRHIEEDTLVSASMSTASNYFGATASRNDFNVTGDMDGFPATYTKNDVVIAVVDTGIDFSHTDLNGGKVIGWKDFVNFQLQPYDDNMHGTHVSGIAAGQGDGNSLYRGVAPGAALVGVKVLNRYGSGSITNIIDGLEWVVANKDFYGIEIVNMSLGSSGSSNGQDAMSVAVNTVYDSGILPVVAAGNSGPRSKTIGSPGAAANALTVCSMADPGESGFFLSDFSSRGPTADLRIKPDICAPGHNITAPKANTSASYTTLSGTSMASPFVAGTAALLIDSNPSLTPADIVEAITETAQDWGPVGKDIDYGSGKLNVYDSIGFAAITSDISVISAPNLPGHYFVTEDLGGAKQKDAWLLNVSSLDPIAATAIYPGWSSSTSPNFNLYILNSAYTIVKKSTLTNRQDTAYYKPSTKGIYYIVVVDKSGTGNYYLDISATSSTDPSLYLDDYTGGAPPPSVP